MEAMWKQGNGNYRKRVDAEIMINLPLFVV